jgi:hypothetical protein
LRLDGIEQGRSNKGRHRDRDPLVFGDLFACVATSRLGRSASGRTEARSDRRPTGFAKRGFAFVGRVFQHIPDGLVIPVLFASTRPDTHLLETATYLIDRAAVVPDPRKDLLHHAGFIAHDVEACLSAAFLLVHIPVAVGCMTQDPDVTFLRGVPFAASAPFEKFGPLVFRNDALHLQQQLVFRRVPQGAVEKDDLDSSLRQFIEQ